MNDAMTASQNDLFFYSALTEQPDSPPEIMGGLQKASPANRRRRHHHSQQRCTVLLSEASDVEKQVRGDGDTEVRLCSFLDVQL